MNRYRVALLSGEDGALERTEQTAERDPAGDYRFSAENGDTFAVRCGPVCSVRRTGEISYEMVFSPGQWTKTEIRTPYGAVPARVYTFGLERRADGFSAVYTVGYPEAAGRRRTDFRVVSEVET